MGSHLRLSDAEYDARLVRAMRACIADGLFPSVREVHRRMGGGDKSKIGHVIRAKIESGEIEIPELMPGLACAQGQWARKGLRAGRRPAAYREPVKQVEPARQVEQVEFRIPDEEIERRAAEIKAENLRTGRVDRVRPLTRAIEERGEMTASERAVLDYRVAMRRIRRPDHSAAVCM